MLSIPIVILAELKRRGGSARDRELYESVKKIVESMNNDISISQFNRFLMILEIRGFIRVEQIKKNTRMIYMLKNRLG